MKRRSFLQRMGVWGAVVVSGCREKDEQSTAPRTPDTTDSPTASATPTDTATATPTPDERLEFLSQLVTAVDRVTRAWSVEVDDVSGEFEATLKRDGEYKQTGLAFLEALQDVAEFTGEINIAARGAASVARRESVSESDVTTLRRWLESPGEFLKLPLLSTEPRDGQITGGLADTSGDGVPDGFLFVISPSGAYEWFREPAPILAEIRANLAGDAYTERQLRYLFTVANYRPSKGSKYGQWAQAGRQGLLTEATADGEISDATLSGIRNSSDDGLIDAQAEALGFDPNASDTAGDGFPDHLSWLMRAEFGFPVHTKEPDVYVEWATVSGVDGLSSRERRSIRELFQEAPGGPIHVHFVEGRRDVKSMNSEITLTNPESTWNQTELGHHILLLNDGSIDGLDGENQGVASWVDGSLPRDERTGVIAHELGHSFGINQRDFGGVDSEQYPLQEYNSVMNYNYDHDLVGFNDGEPFDDWDHMRSKRFGAADLDLSKLRGAWPDGAE